MNTEKIYNEFKGVMHPIVNGINWFRELFEHDEFFVEYIKYMPKNIQFKYYKKALNNGDIQFSLLPQKLRTVKNIKKYLTLHKYISVNIISIIPVNEITCELIEFIIEQSPTQIKFIEDNSQIIKNSLGLDDNSYNNFIQKLCTLSIELSRFSNLHEIPLKYRTYNICLKAIQKCGDNIRYVPSQNILDFSGHILVT